MRGGAFKPFLFHIEMQNILKLVNKVFSFLELLRKKQVPIITELMDEKHLDLICEVTDIIQIDQETCRIILY